MRLLARLLAECGAGKVPMLQVHCSMFMLQAGLAQPWHVLCWVSMVCHTVYKNQVSRFESSAVLRAGQQDPLDSFCHPVKSDLDRRSAT